MYLLHECSKATPVFLSKLSKQDWQLASAFTAVMNGRTVCWANSLTSVLTTTHTHTHACMYVLSTLPAPYAMHTLSSLAYFFQHSVLHAAPQDTYTTYPMHTHHKCKEYYLVLSSQQLSEKKGSTTITNMLWIPIKAHINFLYIRGGAGGLG